jgi:hypothetical protein
METLITELKQRAELYAQGTVEDYLNHEDAFEAVKEDFIQGGMAVVDILKAALPDVGPDFRLGESDEG